MFNIIMKSYMMWVFMISSYMKSYVTLHNIWYHKFNYDIMVYLCLWYHMYAKSYHERKNDIIVYILAMAYHSHDIIAMMLTMISYLYHSSYHTYDITCIICIMILYIYIYDIIVRIKSMISLSWYELWYHKLYY